LVVTGSGVYRFDDLDGDHRYESAGERRDYVTNDKLSTSVYHASGGLLALSPTLVLYVDNGRLNDTIPGVNAIYALRDLDDDGVAMSAGEARPWYAGFDPQATPTPPIWSLTLGPDGAVFAVRNTGYYGGLPREVIRFVDGNADGDVDDAGETTVVATTTDLVKDIAIDREGGVWYLEPGENAALYHVVGGVSEVVVSEVGLTAKGLRVYQDGSIDMLDDAPVFDIVDDRNPLGGTLATIRDGDVRIIWEGRATEQLDQQILFRDFEVLPDRSVMALRDDGEGYNGALYRLVHASSDGDYADLGEASRVLDPRVLATRGSAQPQHTYSLAAMMIE
jgi:hypothetical protein